MPISADNFFGGLLVEIFVACMLYGITTLQTFLYYQKYRNDTAFLKLFVAAVWVLETIHTVFCVQVVYAYTVQQFGEFGYFKTINWGVGVTVLTEVVLSTLVQAFYVRRVWIMSDKSKLLTAAIAFFTVCRAGFGIASTILSYRYPNWLEFRAHNSSLVTVSGGLGAAALVDVLVALTLSVYLTRGRSNWQKEANGRINLIMLYAVNTGAITGTASVLSVILYATQKQSLVFLGLVEIQGKLYANSFLGSLNARSHMRNKNTNPAQYPSFESCQNSNSNGGFRSVPSPQAPKVEVYSQTVVTNDMGVHVRVDDAEQDEYGLNTLKGGELV